MFMSGGYQSSLNILGCRSLIRKCNMYKRCWFSCTFGLFDAYGNSSQFCEKYHSNNISAKCGSSLQAPRCAVKPKLGYELLFFAIQARAPYWHSSPL